MRSFNRTLLALFATVSTLTLGGCLGTDTPEVLPAAIYEQPNGTGFVARRSAGLEDITTTTAGAASGTIGTGGDGALTAYTNGTSGATGFILQVPGDGSNTGNPDNVALGNGQFTASTQAVFPAGTLQASTTTTTGTQSIVVDKFGASQGLTTSEYGVWAESATAGTAATPGLSSAASGTTGGVFAIGVPTAIMPLSGTATYTGSAEGIATTGAGGGEFSGTATMHATFNNNPGGNIYGTITNIKYAAAGGNGAVTGTMNDINLGAAGATAGNIVGNTYSGATVTTGAMTGTSGATNLNIAGATGGTFGGTFAGTSAAEVVGTFKVTGGGVNVIGALGGRN